VVRQGMMDGQPDGRAAERHDSGIVLEAESRITPNDIFKALK